MKKLLRLLAVVIWLSTAFADTTEQNALSTTAELVVPAVQVYQTILIRNLDATISIYVGFTSGVSSTTGMLLKASESIEIRTKSTVYAIAASGTPTVAIMQNP